ncbi:MAG: YlbF family regulator [Verrucomicrobiia bacterium]
MISPIEPLAQDKVLLDSVRALCADLIASPAFAAHRRAVEEFMHDETARALFERATDFQLELNRKHSENEIISEVEEEEFEALRQEVLANARCRAFVEAQEDLKNTEATLHLYITRTLQLGRVPSEEELLPEQACGCGSGGSCSPEDCSNADCQCAPSR